jgi:hypothetical protein
VNDAEGRSVLSKKRSFQSITYQNVFPASLEFIRAINHQRGIISTATQLDTSRGIQVHHLRDNHQTSNKKED